MRTLPTATVELIGQLNMIAEMFTACAKGPVPSAAALALTCKQAAIRLEELANAIEEIAPIMAELMTLKEHGTGTEH